MSYTKGSRKTRRDADNIIETRGRGQFQKLAVSLVVHARVGCVCEYDQGTTSGRTAWQKTTLVRPMNVVQKTSEAPAHGLGEKRQTNRGSNPSLAA